MTSHRGLSAVVGTVFLIAVVIGALSYVSYSLEIMGNFSESLIVEESRQQAKQSEAFEIESIDITDSDQLDGVIKNTGDIPVQLTTLWIDEQDVNDVVQKFTLDAELSPGESVDISSLVDFTMDSTKGYNMKVVSSRGEVNSFYVNSVANQDVYMTLTASSTVIPSTFSTTLLFTVVNNMTNGNYLYNLTPSMNDTKQIIMTDSAGLTSSRVSGPTPESYDSLGPGEVAVFTYVYELTSETDLDTQVYNVTLANANVGNEALTQVSVKAVPLATDAGSALTSLGLTETTADLTDVLYFHIDTSLTPNGEWSMDGSSPNSGGTTQSPNGNTFEFISAPMVETTTVPIGEYTAALNYYTSPVPLGFPQPNFAFFMDCRDCGDNNQIGSSVNDYNLDEGLTEYNSPEFSADGGLETPGGGPDGDEYYHFDDSDNEELYTNYFLDHGTYRDDMQVGHYPDADAFWIRIDPTSDTKVPLIVAYEWDTGHMDYYGFWLIDGAEIRYGWETAHDHHGSYPDNVNCDSSSSDSDIYDDGQWHHIVGIRDGKYSCKLYIDGELEASLDLGDIGDDEVDHEYWSIGYDREQGGDFSGDIASWIHWNGVDGDLNSIPTTQEQITDLYLTNYGVNATRLMMSVEVMDTLGTTQIAEVIPPTEVQLPFKDVVLGNEQDHSGDWLTVDTTNSTDAKYYGDASGDNRVDIQGNATLSSTAVTTLQVGERLKLTLDWDSVTNADKQNLPINIMWDDSLGWTLPAGPSYMQTPEPTPRWPTFLTFNYDENLTFRAYNEGPEGIWFTFPGTRFVLTSEDGLNSFAAMPRYVNFTTAPSPATTWAVIDHEQDSMYIPAEYYAEIDFWQIQAPPTGTNSPCNGCDVPTGSYDAALYLNGYDESGETFLKTVDLGLVHITGNP